MFIRILLILSVIGCAGERPAGLASTEPGNGPMVVHDALHKPEPEVAFPNNAATLPAPEMLTGRRLNISEEAPLYLERRFRSQLNRLDGFSVWSSISVPFDAPIDLDTVSAKSVLLYDVTAGSPGYGQRVPIDLADGHFPLNMRPRNVFAFDPQNHLSNLLFPEDNQVDGKTVEHYEVATNTLMFRPLFPLRPKTTYAVVLTKDIKGRNGHTIRSPFEGVNHATQSLDLAPVNQWVEGGAGNVAYAWTFTTQSVYDDMVLIRDGLDGKGQLSWLKNEYPASFATIVDMGLDTDGDGTYVKEGLEEDPRDHRFTLKPEFLDLLLAPFSAFFKELNSVKWNHLDYAVFGRINSPDFREEKGGIWVDRIQGTTHHKPATVPFALTVPRTTKEHKPPFPVIIYSHGARTSRFELLLVANDMAKRGFAMMGVDAAGHGPFGGDLEKIIEQNADQTGPEIVTLIAALLGPYLLGDDYDSEGKSLGELLKDFSNVGLWNSVFVEGRTTDMDGDGILLSGDGYFVANPFEMSGNARQTILDNMMIYNLLTGFTQAAVPDKALANPRDASDEELMKHMIVGDFNADGVLDIGGPDNIYYAMGTSLGGIHTSVFTAIEPGLTAAVPIVSGGGMVDVMVRTTLADAVDAIFAEVMGPAVVGCPVHKEGESPLVSLSWNNWSKQCDNETTISLSEFDRIPTAPGGTVTLFNARLNDEGGIVYADDALHESAITESGGFGVTVAADEGDLLVLEVRNKDGELVGAPLELKAERGGLGRMRNSPRFRRLLQVAQSGMDRGDPIAYARHLIREPIHGATPTPILHLTDVGDKTVPFSTMIAWDRAAGLLGLDDVIAMDISDEFLKNEALDGKEPHWDVDGFLTEKTCKPKKYICGNSIGPLPTVPSGHGVSAVRFSATDDHEFIAVGDPKDAVNWAGYGRNQAAWFFETLGKEIVDDLCLEDASCPFMTK